MLAYLKDTEAFLDRNDSSLGCFLEAAIEKLHSLRDLALRSRVGRVVAANDDSLDVDYVRQVHVRKSLNACVFLRDVRSLEINRFADADWRNRLLQNV